MSPAGVTVVDHVLLRRLVSILRAANTPHPVFRDTLDDAARILAYEAMRGLRATEYELDTPLEPTTGVRLAGEVVIVAILRAGLGMVDGFLRLVPDARVGHLGMYRDEEALRPVGYYENIPPGVAEASVFVVDPMLATGGSAVQAVGRLERAGARDVSFICLVAAPEGDPGPARRAPRAFRSRPRRSTASWTPTATSAPASATRATASSAPTDTASGKVPPSKARGPFVVSRSVGEVGSVRRTLATLLFTLAAGLAVASPAAAQAPACDPFQTTPDFRGQVPEGAGHQPAERGLHRGLRRLPHGGRRRV